MKLLTLITFLLMAIVASTTVWFVTTLKPSSIGAYMFFSGWLVSPYAIMSAALLYLRFKGEPFMHWCAVAVVVSLGGILFLADVIFWHRDAQGAIAVLMTPILQGGALILLSPIAWWMSRKQRN